MGTHKNHLSETVLLRTKNISKKDGQENIHNLPMANFLLLLYWTYEEKVVGFANCALFLV